MGLGMRPPMMGGGPPGYGPPGQGPPLSALSAQPHLPLPPQQQPQPTGPKLTAFVGSISPGITDAFLIQLLSVCTLSAGGETNLTTWFLLFLLADVRSPSFIQTHTHSNWEAGCFWLR